jgi:hypothetical protein
MRMAGRPAPGFPCAVRPGILIRVDPRQSAVGAYRICAPSRDGFRSATPSDEGFRLYS